MALLPLQMLWFWNKMYSFHPPKLSCTVGESESQLTALFTKPLKIALVVWK